MMLPDIETLTGKRNEKGIDQPCSIAVWESNRQEFLQQRQELKNRGRELSKAFGTEENSHMVAKKWAFRR